MTKANTIARTVTARDMGFSRGWACTHIEVTGARSKGQVVVNTRRLLRLKMATKCFIGSVQPKVDIKCGDFSVEYYRSKFHVAAIN
jgi:hypothetical protein